MSPHRASSLAAVLVLALAAGCNDSSSNATDRAPGTGGTGGGAGGGEGGEGGGETEGWRLGAFGADPASGVAPLETTFSWRIVGAGGLALACELDFDGDGTIDLALDRCAAEGTAAHLFATPGDYRASLVVRDLEGARAELTADVGVEADRAPIIEAFAATPDGGWVPLDASFSWTISDPEGGALVCELDFDGDGAADGTIEGCTSTSGATHAYEEAGVHAAELVVRDAAGNEARRSVEIVTEGRLIVGDVVADSAEWGQSVIHSSLALVANKEALLRVHVLGSVAGIEGVEVEAEAFAGETSLGTLPLDGPAAPPTEPLPGELTEQYRALVPPSWIEPGLRIEVRVDPDDAIGETDEHNNVLVLEPAVDVRAPLPVLEIPISHSGLTGKTVDFEQYVTQIWPLHAVDMTVRAAYTYTPGDNGPQLGEVLGELYTLRRSEGDDRYYMGMMPGVPNQGVVGLGYVGYPAAVAKDDSSGTPSIVAHELGHNFDLHHAPCGVDSYDASYPYAGAQLGSWGWNYVTRSLVAPTTARDLMSYCRPQWVSDYNYAKVQGFLRSHPPALSPLVAASRAGPEEGLLLFGGIGPKGATLRPVHRVLAVPTESEGPYAVRLVGAGGEERVATFDAPALDHGEEGERHFAVVVRDPGPLARVSIERDGEVLFVAEAGPHVPAAPPKLLERDGELELAWDAGAHPHAAIAHLEGGARTTLALGLRGGRAAISTAGLPAAGAFEVSLSDGLNAERFVLAR